MATIYRLGSKGDGVGEIQLALKLAGHSVTMDGYYGPKTRDAVTAFQRSRGIGADGIVGPKTMALLKEVLAMGTAAGMLAITNGYIYQHVTRCEKRAIRYIAVHYTAGTTSRMGQAMQVRQVFLPGLPRRAPLPQRPAFQNQRRHRQSSHPERHPKQGPGRRRRRYNPSRPML